MAKIHFEADDKSCDAEPGEWMYDVCERAGASIPFACKAGACGTCATEFKSGLENLDPAGARELRTLQAQGLGPDRYRLPCLYEVRGDLRLGVAVHGERRKKKLNTHIATVESYRPLNLAVCELRFFVPDESFSFRPGQYMIFRIPKKGGKPISRSYSISSPPSDRRHFEICVRAVAGGHASNFIHRLRPGRKLRVEGPHGEFALEENSSKDILMLANGTGIAPLKSMLAHLLDEGSSRRVRLYFGVRHESDLFYTDVLRGLAAHYPQLETRICLSQPSAAGWSGHHGRLTSLIEKEVLASDAAGTEVYQCGSRGMIESSRRILLGKGFPAEAFHSESFY